MGAAQSVEDARNPSTILIASFNFEPRPMPSTDMIVSEKAIMWVLDSVLAVTKASAIEASRDVRFVVGLPFASLIMLVFQVIESETSNVIILRLLVGITTSNAR